MRHFGFAFLLGGLSVPAMAGEISVSVVGAAKDSGSIVLCLWGGDEGFPDCEKGKPLKRIVVPAGAGTATFADVPPGSYAVSAFHDLNSNGVLDSNFIGLPKEPVGLSNNPKIMGPPRFKPAQFSHADRTSISIRLQGM